MSLCTCSLTMLHATGNLLWDCGDLAQNVTVSLLAMRIRMNCAQTNPSKQIDKIMHNLSKSHLHSNPAPEYPSVLPLPTFHEQSLLFWLHPQLQSAIFLAHSWEKMSSCTACTKEHDSCSTIRILHRLVTSSKMLKTWGHWSLPFCHPCLLQSFSLFCRSSLTISRISSKQRSSPCSLAIRSAARAALTSSVARRGLLLFVPFPLAPGCKATCSRRRSTLERTPCTSWESSWDNYERYIFCLFTLEYIYVHIYNWTYLFFKYYHCYKYVNIYIYITYIYIYKYIYIYSCEKKSTIYLFIYLSIYLFFLSIYLSIYLFIYLFIIIIIIIIRLLFVFTT